MHLNAYVNHILAKLAFYEETIDESRRLVFERSLLTPVIPLVGSPVNDATVYNVLEGLKASMLIDEQEKVYRVNDPVPRTLLLTAKIG